jgi:large subunit ribosomal protein L24
MKIKKGDNVLIIAGKDKGRTGKIMKALPKELKILVEGINLKKKHVRPKKEGEKGQVVEIPAPLDISNVKIICKNCGKATRIGYKTVPTESRILDGKAIGKKDVKNRICKKCKQII